MDGPVGVFFSFFNLNTKKTKKTEKTQTGPPQTLGQAGPGLALAAWETQKTEKTLTGGLSNLSFFSLLPSPLRARQLKAQGVWPMGALSALGNQLLHINV